MTTMQTGNYRAAGWLMCLPKDLIVVEDEPSMERVNRRRFLRVASIGVAGAALSACGKDPAETENLRPTAFPDVAGAPPTPKPSDGTPEAEAETPVAENGGASFAVATLDALKFDPPELTIPANAEVTITVSNEGFLQHDFVIDELGIKTKLLANGESEDVTINAPAGTFEYYCSVSGHRESGMVGTLTISDDAAPPPAAGDGEATPGGEATPAAAPEAGAPPSSGPLAVQALDVLKFDPAELSAPANTPTVITVTNAGFLQHDFVIDELKIATKLLNNGESEDVTINAPAGTYKYYCSVPGHRPSGMEGTLTVA